MVDRWPEGEVVCENNRRILDEMAILRRKEIASDQLVVRVGFAVPSHPESKVLVHLFSVRTWRFGFLDADALFDFGHGRNLQHNLADARAEVDKDGVLIEVGLLRHLRDKVERRFAVHFGRERLVQIQSVGFEDRLVVHLQDDMLEKT